MFTSTNNQNYTYISCNPSVANLYTKVQDRLQLYLQLWSKCYGCNGNCNKAIYMQVIGSVQGCNIYCLFKKICCLKFHEKMFKIYIGLFLGKYKLHVSIENYT